MLYASIHYKLLACQIIMTRSYHCVGRGVMEMHSWKHSLWAFTEGRGTGGKRVYFFSPSLANEGDPRRLKISCTFGQQMSWWQVRWHSWSLLNDLPQWVISCIRWMALTISSRWICVACCTNIWRGISREVRCGWWRCYRLIWSWRRG